MTWNYRVVRHAPDDFLLIHEVYYDDRGEPESVTERGAEVGSETLDGIRSVLAMMDAALAAPILDYANIARKEEVT